MSRAYKAFFNSKDPDAIPSEEDAHAAAISEIRAMFSSSEQIQSRVLASRAEYEKKKAQVDAQLSNLINTQIEESRYALELLGNSTTDMATTRQSFNEIDEYCKTVQSYLPHYDPIKKVAVARKNLATTIGLLELFRSIPKKAEELLDKLDDDRELKNIYKEIRRLIALRDKAFSKGLEYGGSGMKETVHETFEALQNVATELEERVWMNIRDCIPLAREDPATLVRTLEVIEMEDRASVKVFSHTLGQVKAKSSSSSSSSSPHSSAADSNDDSDADENGNGSGGEQKTTEVVTMRQRCFEELETSIADHFAIMFHDRKETDDPNKEHKEQTLPEMLKTAKNLIDDLEEVSEFMAKCFPPEYKIFRFYEERYQKWLYSRFVARIGDPSEVAPGDILFTINWIQEYLARISEIGIQANTSSELEKYSDLLMESYLTQIKKTMLEWVSNICRRERDVVPTQDEQTGVYTTNATQDLFTLTINQQVDIAFKNLTGRNFVSVMKICCDVLTFFSEQMLRYLKDPSFEKSEEYLCAVVNTLHECAEHTMKLKDRCITFLEDENMMDESAELDDYFENPISGFVSVSQQSAQLLRIHIMNTIDTVIDKAFGSEWLQSDAFAEESVVTLQDFFGDYSNWLASDFHMGRVVKDVCHHLVSRYVAKLIDRKPMAKANPELIWQRVAADTERLEGYFADEQFHDLVPPQLIHSEFDAVRSIQEILRAEETFMTVYFEALIKRFGSEEALHMFTELLSMRTDIDRSTRNDLIEKFEDKAKSMEAANNKSELGAFSSIISEPEKPTSRGGLFSFWS